MREEHCNQHRTLKTTRQLRPFCFSPGFSAATSSDTAQSLTSAAGTPSGGRQWRTIIPSIGTSFPCGSCSKFFRKSAEFNAIVHYTSKSHSSPNNTTQAAEVSNKSASPYSSLQSAYQATDNWELLVLPRMRGRDTLSSSVVFPFLHH